MKIELRRTMFNRASTQGELWIDGKLFCQTLEPHRINWRCEKKIKGETAIPEGKYRIELRRSATFGRVMPYLVNVPYFLGVMLHPGNYVTQTKGCILVGKYSGVGRLRDSKNTFLALFERIVSVYNDEEVTITITSPGM